MIGARDPLGNRSIRWIRVTGARQTHKRASIQLPALSLSLSLTFSAFPPAKGRSFSWEEGAFLEGRGNTSSRLLSLAGTKSFFVNCHCFYKPKTNELYCSAGPEETLMMNQTETTTSQHNSLCGTQRNFKHRLMACIWNIIEKKQYIIKNKRRFFFIKSFNLFTNWHESSAEKSNWNKGCSLFV